MYQKNKTKQKYSDCTWHKTREISQVFKKLQQLVVLKYCIESTVLCMRTNSYAVQSMRDAIKLPTLRQYKQLPNDSEIPEDLSRSSFASQTSNCRMVAATIQAPRKCNRCEKKNRNKLAEL